MKLLTALALVLSIGTAQAEPSCTLAQGCIAPPLTVPGWKVLPADAHRLATQPQSIVHTPAPTPRPDTEAYVLRNAIGGIVREHEARYRAIGASGVEVKVYGQCLSACTLVLAYISRDKLCFAQGSVLGFHAARIVSTQQQSLHATVLMYIAYPADIREWLDANGGPTKMSVEKFWPLRDHELWAMGYRKCQ